MVKLYNSELQISLKITNLPIDLYSDLEIFHKIKESLKKLSYEIISETDNIESTIIMSPVTNVELIEPDMTLLLNFITQKVISNSLLITINPILVEKFRLPLEKIKKTIEVLLNKIIYEIIKKDAVDNKNSNTTDTIDNIEKKIKKYEVLLAKNVDNKIKTDKIGNKLIRLNTLLNKLKEKNQNNENTTNFTDF